MGLEAATYIDELVSTNPTGADDKNQGDNHLRLIKEVLQAQFPNLGTAALTLTAAELNAIPAEITAVEGDITTIEADIVDLQKRSIHAAVAADSAGGIIGESSGFNISSVNRTAVGRYTVTLTTGTSTAGNMIANVSVRGTGTVAQVIKSIVTSATTIDIVALSSTGTYDDAGFYLNVMDTGN